MNQYILAHNFLESKYYVRVNENNTWDEIRDPRQASLFLSKEDAVNWSKENTTFGEYAVGLKVSKEVKEFEDSLINGLVRRSFNIIDKSFSRKYNGENRDEILEWWIKYRMADDTQVRYEDYKTWPPLYSVFENLWESQSYLNNDYSKKHYTFQMRVKSNAEYSVFEEELNKILLYVTYIDEKGYKIISIFDRFLSEDGGVMFHYTSPSDCFIEGYYDRILISGNLKKVFEYWKKERYYD